MRTGVVTTKANILSASPQRALGHTEQKRRLWFVGLLMVLFALAVKAYPAEESTHVHNSKDTIAASEHEPATNVICPVMRGNKADPKIFTDYKGKRVYFCCLNCKAAFEKNPKEYLALLPQFGGVETHVGNDHEGHGSRLTLAGLIKPVGIATLLCLVLTVAAALLRRKKPKLLLTGHKRLGIITLAFAMTHAILVLIVH